ncbi:MAG: LacI family DNA-binding transcriptional regulator [Lachnospiraceae bacterium]|nr:LacI family DNA-binding transcriptional regulator [Lachnospiraceae bacterium]
MNKVTIKDVAKEAGVSISTVSNALNGTGSLSEETKQMVLDVANRLNYIPNINGRGLKTGSSKMIGFYTISVNGAYFYELVDSMYTECEKRGFGLNIMVTHDLNLIASHALSRRVDGVIIYQEAAEMKRVEEILRVNEVRTVFLDREIEDKYIGSVVFDSYQGGIDATNYLIENGHKRIGYINGTIGNYDCILRTKGYKDALAQHGLEYNPAWTIEGDFREAVAYKNMTEYLDNGGEIPDAFFACNDLSAIGVMRALKEHGYSVPEDVSVIGIDDIEVAKYIEPGISTIKNQISGQGALAVSKVFDMMSGENGDIKRLPGRLVVRNSVKNINGTN